MSLASVLSIGIDCVYCADSEDWISWVVLKL